MGIRGEIFSKRFSSSNERRTYFLNVKENRKGDIFLNIVESKPSAGQAGFERFQVLVFEEDVAELLDAMDEVRDFISDYRKDGKNGGASRRGRTGESRDDD